MGKSRCAGLIGLPPYLPAADTGKSADTAEQKARDEDEEFAKNVKNDKKDPKASNKRGPAEQKAWGEDEEVADNDKSDKKAPRSSKKRGPAASKSPGTPTSRRPRVAPAPPGVTARLCRMETIMGKFIDLEEKEIEAQSNAQAPVPTPTPPCSNISSLLALKNSGLPNVKPSDLPSVRMINYTKGLMDAARRVTGPDSKPFIYLDPANKVFKTGFSHKSATKSGYEASPMIERPYKEWEEIRDHTPDPAPSMSLGQWLTFQWRSTLLSSICGFAAECGGAQEYIVYYNTLMTRLCDERVVVIVRVDQMLREHFSTLATNGQNFSMVDEADRLLENYVAKVHRVLDAQPPKEKKGKGKGKSGDKGDRWGKGSGKGGADRARGPNEPSA